MHQNLLRDVITKQAGTLDKAVLEGVMNLIEAKATKGEVTLNRTKLVIKDDGKGFETKDEVIAAFEVFGKSDERKAENKRFAKYQMGRGQLFAFGKTTYRTRTFEMTVDINSEMGLGYALKEGLPDLSGCTVTVQLYEALDPYDITRIGKEIGRNVKYVDIPIYFNGELSSTDPGTQKWTLETEDAYFKFNQSSHAIEIYNLGVYVRHEYGGGMGGIVVSKQQLDLNFARNDVIRSCPVWKSISKQFKSKSKKTLLEKKSFKPEETVEVFARLENEEYTRYDVSSLKLFKTTNGKRLSPVELQNFDMIAFDEAGEILADKAMQAYNVIVLDQDFMLGALGIFREDAIHKTLDSRLHLLGVKLPKFVTTKELYKDLDGEYHIFKDNELNKVEKIALGVLRRWFSGPYPYAFNSARSRTNGVKGRQILVGKSSSARAWTDGTRFIAIDRDVLKTLVHAAEGWAELLLLMAHEFAHTGSERTHDEDFHERYHELSFDFISAFRWTYREFVRRLAKAQTGQQAHRNFAIDIERLEGHFLEDPLDQEAEFVPAPIPEVAEPQSAAATPKKRGRSAVPAMP